MSKTADDDNFIEIDAVNVMPVLQSSVSSESNLIRNNRLPQDCMPSESNNQASVILICASSAKRGLQFASLKLR